MVTNDCGVSQTTINFVVIECPIVPDCPCSKANTFNLVPDAGQTEIILSQSNFYNAVGISYNGNIHGCITIAGRLRIDTDFTFNHAEMVMQPGSEIYVNRGIRLTLSDDHIHSCKNLWKGIYFDYSNSIAANGANINAHDNIIEDAVYAFHFRGGNNGDISRNHFLNNHIGINIDGIPLQSLSHAFNVRISDNDFHCERNLLPHYDPNVNIVGGLNNRGYAGIYGTFAAFDVGLFNSKIHENRFYGIYNGIVTHRSIGEMYFPLIRDLASNVPPINQITPNVIDNTGMYLSSSSYNIHSAIIRGVTKGIHLTNNNFFWMDNTSVDAPHAIYNVDTRGDFRFFRGNTISANQFGIRFFQSPNFLSTIGVGGDGVITNTFNINNPVNGPAAAGISLETFPAIPATANVLKTIQSNQFNLQTGCLGISLNRDGRYEIDNNNISFTDANQDGTGIQLVNSSNNRLWGNNINTDNGQPLLSCTGIGLSSASLNNTLCCNNTSNVSIGVRLSNNANGTQLRNTIFGEHSIDGLRLSANTTVGVQTHAGNRWTGTLGNPTARFLGNPSLSLRFASRFEIRDPQGTAIFPNNIIPTVGWFTGANAGTTAICQTDAVCLPAPIFKGSSGSKIEIPELVLTIAKNGFAKEQFGDCHQWEGGRWVLNELLQNPDWVGVDADLDAFADWAKKSAMQTCNDIDALMGQFDLPNDQEKAILEEQKGVQVELRAQLQKIDEILEQSPKDADMYMAQRAEILDKMYSLFLTIQAVNTEINERKAQLIAQAQKLNGSIELENIFAQNEQRINEIYLNILATGKNELNESEKEFVSHLAHQCYWTAGASVSKARVLFALFGEEQFDDEKICATIIKEIPVLNKVAQNWNQNIVKIYPNPVDKSLTIESSFKNTTQVILRSIDGRILFSKAINSKEIIATDTFENGVIFCEIWNSGHRITTEKIIIIH